MSTFEVDKDPRDIILKPAATEKSSILMDENKYTLEIGLRVSETKIKIVIKAIFGIKTGQVTTQNRKGKTYRTRTDQGKRKDVKCAIVTLHEGAVDIFGDQA